MFSKAKKSNSGSSLPGEMTEITATESPGAKPLPKSTSKMSGKKPVPRSVRVPSIISADVTIIGSIKAEDEVQLDGVLEGDIEAKRLVVGEGAMVKGEVVCGSVRVSGTVEGSIRADSVELSSSAHVKGDIFHTALSIEIGARFDGNCRYSDNPLSENANSTSTPPAKSPARPVPAPSPAKVSNIGAPTDEPATAQEHASPNADVTFLETKNKEVDIATASSTEKAETENTNDNSSPQLKPPARVGSVFMKRQGNAKPLR